jgi:hypothetical protein
MSAPTTSLPDPAIRYATFVNLVARDSAKFKALQEFLDLGTSSVGESNITRVDFPSTGGPLRCTTVDQSGLHMAITDGSSRKLFVVENLSPTVVKTLGGYLKIDPQFFLDYIDAIPKDFDITKPKRERDNIVPTPWYRFEKIDGHLPALISLKQDSEYIQLQYIGSREYLSTGFAPERMKPDLAKMNIERIAGLQVPIMRDGKHFCNIAMTRHFASVWFKRPEDPSNPEWTVGKCFLKTNTSQELPLSYQELFF